MIYCLDLQMNLEYFAIDSQVATAYCLPTPYIAMYTPCF